MDSEAGTIGMKPPVSREPPVKATLTNPFPPLCVTPAAFLVKTNLAGQGGNPLVANFVDHQIVKCSGDYY